MTQRYIGGLIYNPPGGYSGYFNGSSSLSISSSNTVLPTGTQDFCVEMWFSWQTQSGSYPQLISNPTTNGFQIYYDVASGLFAVGIFNVSNVITYTISQTALSGGWNHLAVTRSGNTFRLFLNGILQANGTNTISFASVTTQYIGSDGSRPYTGYLSNVRTVLGAIPTPYQTSSTTNGTAVFTPPNGALQAITSTALLTCAFATFRDGSTNNYTITVNSATVSTQNPFPLTTLPNPALGNQGNGIFSMSQYQSLKQQNLWPAIDPYFDYTTLLLHGNGTNGGQNNTFLDSSSNNFTITRNGNTTQGTFSPFSQTGWSNYFDGSSSLTPSSGSFLALGTSNYTIEFWIYLTQNVGNNHALAINANNGLVVVIGDAKTSLNQYNIGDVVATGSGLSINTWHHVAIVRAGTGANQTSIYINGTRSVQGTDATNWTVTTNPRIGGNTANQYIFGYMSNVRVVTSAIYSGASIPVPTVPLTAISGTTFLTLQNNRFLDNGTTAATFTTTGSPSVQAFSPFAPTAAYGASTVGGSGYFDGSGDWLNLNNSGCYPSGTQDTTVELWWYPTSIPSVPIFLNNETTGSFGLYYESGALKVDSRNSSTILSASYTFTANQWYHIAYSRSGNTHNLYVNGTRIGTGSNSVSFATAGNPQNIMAQPASSRYTPGYATDVRVVLGTALYTGSTLTVPTAPLTAVSNTALLLSYTNGGIIDNAMMNDLETVGNAQISTTQSKFGGASLYFDGTGDYLQAPISPNNNVANGNFTIEAWIYPTSTTGGSEKTIVSTYTNGYIFYIRSSDGKLQFDKYGVSTPITGNTAITANVWTHVAVTRSGNTWYIFINGTQDATATASTTFSNTSTLRVADSGSGSQTFYGYIDDLRITKGIARYTANFTPQTSQWQDQ